MIDGLFPNSDHITRTVTVSLSEIIDRNFEGFLDLLEELCLDQEAKQEGWHYWYYLSDICYQVISVNEDSTLNIAVSANIETEIDDEEGE